LNFTPKSSTTSVAVGVVAKEAGGAGLVIAVLGEPLDEDVLSDSAGVREPVHAFVDLH